MGGDGFLPWAYYKKKNKKEWRKETEKRRIQTALSFSESKLFNS